MAVLTALQVADYWVAAGGPKSRAVEWTGISMGESSFDTAAVSSAGAIGLYQIMPFNAAPNGVSIQDLYDPLINSRVAVKMSGGGVNCAAWDSAYADIQASGRYSFLPWPEQGSADYHNIQIVSVMLGRDKLGGQVPPAGFTPSPQVAQDISQLQTIATKFYPALMKVNASQIMAANAMFVPGWIS